MGPRSRETPEKEPGEERRDANIKEAPRPPEEARNTRGRMKRRLAQSNKREKTGATKCVKGEREGQKGRTEDGGMGKKE